MTPPRVRKKTSTKTTKTKKAAKKASKKVSKKTVNRSPQSKTNKAPKKVAKKKSKRPAKKASRFKAKKAAKKSSQIPKGKGKGSHPSGKKGSGGKSQQKAKTNATKKHFKKIKDRPSTTGKQKKETPQQGSKTQTDKPKVVTFSGLDTPSLEPSVRKPNEDLVITSQAEIEARLEDLGHMGTPNRKPTYLTPTPEEEAERKGASPTSQGKSVGAKENNLILQVIEKVEGVLTRFSGEILKIHEVVENTRKTAENVSDRLQDLENAHVSQMVAKLNASQLFEVIKEISADVQLGSGGTSGGNGEGGEYFLPISDLYWLLTMKGYAIPPQRFRKSLLQLEEDARITLWSADEVPMPAEVQEFYRKETVGVPVGGRGVLDFLSLN